jgi:hypothetical protein
LKSGNAQETDEGSGQASGRVEHGFLVRPTDSPVNRLDTEVPADEANLFVSPVKQVRWLGTFFNPRPTRIGGQIALQKRLILRQLAMIQPSSWSIQARSESIRRDRWSIRDSEKSIRRSTFSIQRRSFSIRRGAWSIQTTPKSIRRASVSIRNQRLAIR